MNLILKMIKDRKELILEMDVFYIDKFKTLPQREDIVVASSIEPNKFHKGEFVIKEIRRSNDGKEYSAMTFVHKEMVKKIMEEIK